MISDNYKLNLYERTTSGADGTVQRHHGNRGPHIVAVNRSSRNSASRQDQHFPKAPDVAADLLNLAHNSFQRYSRHPRKRNVEGGEEKKKSRNVQTNENNEAKNGFWTHKSGSFLPSSNFTGEKKRKQRNERQKKSLRPKPLANMRQV